MKQSILFGIVAVTIFSGCGKSNDTPAPPLAYQLSHNGCTTGFHKFSTTQAMCSSLQDDTFNNSCAAKERADYFHKYCQGDFHPANRSYAFVAGNCETGRHGFKTTKALCRALQNEKLNHSCAEEERESYYKQKCKGTPAKQEVASNLDCAGFVLSETSSVQEVSWSARDLTANAFPDGLPEHSSIYLSCSNPR